MSGIVPRSGRAPLEVPVLPLVLPECPVVLSALAVVDAAAVVSASLALVGGPPEPKLDVAEGVEHAVSNRAESTAMVAFMAAPTLDRSAAAD